MNLKINNNLFIKATVYLILLRSPLILLTIIAYLVTSKKAIIYFMSRMIPFIILMIVFVLYSLNLGNETGQIIGQTRDIVLAFTVAFVLIACAKENGNNSICYNTIKLCFIIIAICKVLLLLYSISSGIGLSVLIKQITQVWGIQMMTLAAEGSAVGRIQIPIDSVVPYLLYFYAKEVFENKNNKIGVLLFLLLCFSMLLTFSRVIWAQTALFILISIVVELKLKTKIKFLITTFVIAGGIIFLTPLGDTILMIINSRVGGGNVNNHASDIQRTIQNAGLWAKVNESPLFGHGLGYYIPTLLRSSEAKYLYESQGLSMLMTLGYIGVTVSLIFISVSLILTENSGYIPLGSVFFLIFWIACGCYNPYLFGASGGVILYFVSQFHQINSMVSVSSSSSLGDKVG
ncbi:O-antigen ligase family protein [Raoultella ornithinolytica]|uniref:O-antigen ligase family protein n=1 Tax=Raoultella TaxID=160674 RepID=UPI0039B4242A